MDTLASLVLFMVTESIKHTWLIAERLREC